jgi:NAD(P)-dependent dehydrogenase (short-subunit alcohol dehydrogenase family)
MADQVNPTLPLTSNGDKLMALGIGLALAKQSYAAGAEVMIGDLRLTPEAEEWSASLPKNEFHFQKCSVDDWASLHALITSAVEHFGDVPDIYVPSAGVYEPAWSNF